MRTDFITLGYVLWFLFLGITFGFSAFEKLADYKGTFRYYSSYFKDTFVARLLKWVLPFIIIVEIIVTILYFLGIFQFLIYNEGSLAFIASFLGSLLLLLFLIGQRIMRDYEGAARLGIYFLLCCLPLLLF